NNENKARELEEETGACSFQADLTDESQVCNVISAVRERLDSIAVLVNNVGRTQVMPFALMEASDWDEIITANLKTMFLVTREVVRDMIQAKNGAIINIGSLAGHRKLEVPVHYATAKAGVSGFTLSLATELARYNIRVNAIVPGLLTEGVGRLVPEPALAEYVRYCSAGRPGDPEEVAEVAVFLASKKSSYINAQNIFVDGGI
ncbi:SDR family NAD(P)-dependent oxidoreductase, partial [Planctomycetota bacterium]